MAKQINEVYSEGATCEQHPHCRSDHEHIMACHRFLGNVIGDPEDIKAHFDKHRSLLILPLKTLSIPPGYAKRKSAMESTRDQLEKALSDLAKELTRSVHE